MGQTYKPAIEIFLRFCNNRNRNLRYDSLKGLGTTNDISDDDRRRRDKQKFAILYETYRHLMMKVALNVLKDTFLAEDAVHEAFIKIAKNMEKIGEIDATATKRYLLTITKNATIDIYRKRNHQFQREIYVDELEECNVPVTYAATDVDDGILDILRCLPVKYRDVFLLKYSGNMDNDEIAKVLNITEGTARQRLSRGKIMIQEALNKREEDNEVLGNN